MEYIARYLFSLARIIRLTDDGDASKSPAGGKILYRASAPNCIPFPKAGDNELVAGNPRNFEIYEPLDFIATVTQHIPETAQVYNLGTMVRYEPLEYFTQQNRR